VKPCDSHFSVLNNCAVLFVICIRLVYCGRIIRLGSFIEFLFVSRTFCVGYKLGHHQFYFDYSHKCAHPLFYQRFNACFNNTICKTAYKNSCTGKHCSLKIQQLSIRIGTYHSKGIMRMVSDLALTDKEMLSSTGSVHYSYIIA